MLGSVAASFDKFRRHKEGQSVLKVLISKEKNGRINDYAKNGKMELKNKSKFPAVAIASNVVQHLFALQECRASCHASRGAKRGSRRARHPTCPVVFFHIVVSMCDVEPLKILLASQSLASIEPPGSSACLTPAKETVVHQIGSICRCPASPELVVSIKFAGDVFGVDSGPVCF